MYDGADSLVIQYSTSNSFAAANFISTLATFGTSFVPEARVTIGIYAGVLICQGLINTFGVHLLKHINNVSIWWHAVGTTAVVVAILAAAPTHQSAKFVFATFIYNTGVDGVGWGERASHAYVRTRATPVALCGLGTRVATPTSFRLASGPCACPCKSGAVRGSARPRRLLPGEDTDEYEPESGDAGAAGASAGSASTNAGFANMGRMLAK